MLHNTEREKKLLFHLIFWILIIGLFCLIEVSLRLVGYGRSYRICVEKEFNGHTYLAINPDAGQKYFFKKVKPNISTDMFLKEKPANTYRVFVLGGSTSAGYPWEYNFSFSNILKEHLSHYKPSSHIEMVNFSMPAVNSYAVLDVFRQISRHDPDLVIVYTGHNEFYGSMGAGGGGRSVLLKRFVLFLRDLRLYQWMEAVVEKLIFMQKEQDTSNLMHRLAGERLVEPDSRIRSAVARQYRKNLNTLCRHAKRHQINLLLMRPVSNVTEFPPFESSGSADQQSIQKVIDSVTFMIRKGEYFSASHELKKQLETAPHNAHLHYLLGQCMLSFQQEDTALMHFKLARDLDAYPFRMTGPLDSVLLRIADKWSVPLFDTDEVLALYQPQNYPRYFCDHLHFSIEGLQKVGESLAEYLLKRPVQLLDQMDHFTRLDSLLGEIRLDILLRTWPYTNDFHVTRPRFIPENDYDRIVMKVWENSLSWEEGHVYAARLLEKEGKLNAAIREYQALWHLMPFNEAPLVESARLAIRLENWDDAEAWSRTAMEIFFNARALLYRIQAEAARAHTGTILSLMESYRDPISHSDPEIKGILYYFEGWAYANRQEYGKALNALDKALDILPGYRQALNLKHDIQAVFQ
ncbi:TPA: hypothetical protein DCG86_01865 [Candidatus Marinimicrobia bacterium]|nr:MAG: Tetratricopeptide TPR_2 repeat-containing protein [Marinimicrobia bacterium 46_47]KUK91533.1 MAG: hypothetical protein XE04_1044 [Marinimicrobia bacterium 46_43]HAE86750.1 hypothetical protein [Candidatus Neomarinimicrobiota bacterium]HBY18070.1 hypothetical protein [Candidatus Neomarinimicrobiota bacterium]